MFALRPTSGPCHASSPPRLSALVCWLSSAPRREPWRTSPWCNACWQEEIVKCQTFVIDLELFFCHRRYLRLARPLSLRRWERRRVVIQQLTPVTRLASWLACPVITRNCGDRAGEEPSPSLNFYNREGFPYDGLLRDCKTSNFAKVRFHL